MEFQGTPGVWTTHKNSSWGQSHVDNFGDKEGYVICFKSLGEVKVLASIIGILNAPKKEIEANAKLIAAAPDMYEALKKLLKEAEDLYTHVIDQGIIDAEDEPAELMQSAIQKAKEAIQKAI